MTFPTIPTGGRVLTTNQLDSSGTRTFPSLSSLTKNSGDLLLAIIYCYQSTAAAGSIFSSWGASFTELADLGGGTNGCLGVAYKWSTGSETGTFTVTQAATITGDASMILLSIPGAHASTVPEITALASGTGAAADPASLDPAGWGTEDTLWIAVGGNGMTSITGSWTGMGSAPTNYTDYVDTNASDTSTIGDCELAVAFRQLNAASEDAGGFTTDVSNARNHAAVIAVRPAPNVFTQTPTDSAGLTDTGFAFEMVLIPTDSAGLTDSASPVLTGGGGTTHTVNQTDSAGLTDTAPLARALVFTDNAGLTDTAALTVAMVHTDSAGLTDTSTVQAAKFVATTDDAGLTDAAVLTQSKVITDSVGLTDSAALAQSKVITDSAGLTDTSTIQAAKLITQTDNAGLTDTGLNLNVAETLTDSVGLTDTAALTRSLVYTDSAGLTDTSTVQAAKLIVQTDSAGLTDTALLTRSLVQTDSTGLTDTSVVAASTTLYTDSVGLTDAAVLNRGLVYTDSAGLTDTTSISSGKLLELTDSAGLTDTQAFANAKVHTDSAGLTDIAALTISKVLTDSAGITDTSVIMGQRDIVATDTVGLTDSHFFARSLGLEDLVGLTDATILNRTLVYTDSTGLRDTATVDLIEPVVIGDGHIYGGRRTTPDIHGGQRTAVPELAGGPR